MRQKALNALLAASGLTVCVALVSPRPAVGSDARRCFVHCQCQVPGPSFDAALDNRGNGIHTTRLQERTGKTLADAYYAKHGTIPRPTRPHVTIPISIDLRDPITNDAKRGILVIGDVHGCFDELQLLHEKAKEENDNHPFEYVILVGDLCNKGPHSAKVIQFVRNQKEWLAIRGNHDDGALAAALGDPVRRGKKSYQWAISGKKNDQISTASHPVVLSDDDVNWLSELPYTIRIPGALLGDDDIVVVHAGLVPGVDIEDQSISAMVTLREVQEITSPAGGNRKAWHAYQGGDVEKSQNEKVGCPLPWASVWQGPPTIIFGHDARCGFQRYPECGDWAIGLDTGCCYGKQLTGIILPSRRIVTVDALDTYSPIVINKE